MSLVAALPRARASSGGKLPFLAVGLAFLLAAGLSVQAFAFSDDAFASPFQLLVAAFAAYLFVECRFYLRRAGGFGLLSPALLASIVHFFLAYILPSTASFFDPWILSRFSAFLPSQSDAQFIGPLLLAMLGAFCMWRGYHVGLMFAPRIRRRLVRLTLLRKSLDPALLPTLLLQFTFVLVTVYAIRLGVFGIASTTESRLENIQIMEFLNIARGAGTLSLFLLLVAQCRHSQAKRRFGAFGFLCAALFVFHVGVGAISGFKTQLVMPFALLAMARFTVSRSFSIKHGIFIAVAMLAAYQIVEPYRAYIYRNIEMGQSDIGTLVDALSESMRLRDQETASDIPLASQIVSRFDLLGMTTVGLTFDDAGYVDAALRDQLAESIYLSPVIAYVPRALWTSKPSYSTGVWFNQVVLRRSEDNTTSVGMGPVTFMYFAGGPFGVALGFFLIGLLQAILFDGLALSCAGGLIIYLSVCSTLIMIPTDFGAALAGLWRMLPLAFIAQYVLLLPRRRTAPR